MQVENNPPGIPHTLVRTLELHIEDRQKTERDFELPFLEHANPSC
jgi:hypothetical protein